MKSILAAVDFSDATGEIVDLACSIARAYGVTIHLLHAAAPDPAFVGLEAGPKSVRDQRARELRGERHLLAEIAASVQKNGIEAEAHLIEGATADTIIREAEKLNAGMIVMGSRGRAPIAKTILGSVSEAVLREATCPVVILPHLMWSG